MHSDRDTPKYHWIAAGAAASANLHSGSGKQYQSDPLEAVQCVVVATRDEAQHWIELRHTGGQNNGAAVVPWGADDAARFRARTGNFEFHTQALNLLEAAGQLTPAKRRKVKSTSLKRLLGTPEVRVKIGIDSVDGKLTITGDERRVLKALLHVGNDMEHVKVRDIYTQQQRIDYMVLNHNADLCRRIELTKVTMREWHRQRDVYENQGTSDLSDLGFAALFLNRTNRSGIIGGGVIGGKGQTGKWGIAARFTKPELIQRIRKAGRYASRIKLYQMDALEFTQTIVTKLGANSLAFYDPPYIENGRGLYLNDYTVEGHRELCKQVLTLETPWMVTYDSAAARHSLYVGCRRVAYDLSYSANGRHKGKEVMFLSPSIDLPEAWNSDGPIVLSPERGEYPVYGTMESMKPHPEMIEGRQAGERFVDALKTVLRVPKSAVPTPFSKPAKKKSKRPATRTR
jgi:DNA adenine methylase